MFILCKNVDCPRACWCKRFTYRNKVDPNDSDYPVEWFTCNETSIYNAYVKNKARQIYERDFPDAAHQYDESDEQQYTNNNRQSWMRKNNNPDKRTVNNSSTWTNSATSDSVLQLQRSSDRRSDNEVSIYDQVTGRTQERLLSHTTDLRDYVTFGQGYALLQDDACTGFYAAGSNTEPPNIPTAGSGVWSFSEIDDIGEIPY